jgi:hypothetical protein
VCHPCLTIVIPLALQNDGMPTEAWQLKRMNVVRGLNDTTWGGHRAAGTCRVDAPVSSGRTAYAMQLPALRWLSLKPDLNYWINALQMYRAHQVRRLIETGFEI